MNHSFKMYKFTFICLVLSGLSFKCKKIHVLTKILFLISSNYMAVSFAETMASPVCPKGWKQFQNKCFIFHSDKSFVTFYEAHLICNDFYNSTLVSIHSDEEQAFLTKFAFSINKAQNHVWIGARRISNDKFVWEDNSPFNYTHWAKTQPNNLDGKHFCASLLQSPNLNEVGYWYDDPCADKYHLICQTYLKESSDSHIVTVSTVTPKTISSKVMNKIPIQTKITLDDLKSLTNKTLPANSSTIAALISSSREEQHISHTNISLIIVSIAEFLIIVSLVYIVFRKTPLPYRTLIMSECSRNTAQNLS